MEKLIQFKLPFSFENAGEPDIELDGADIVVTFKDEYLYPFLKILLGDYIAYKWQMVKTFTELDKAGKCYRIKNSEWLKEHVRQDIIHPDDQYCHYKFNFKDSQLEVLALDIDLIYQKAESV